MLVTFVLSMKIVSPMKMWLISKLREKVFLIDDVKRTHSILEPLKSRFRFRITIKESNYSKLIGLRPGWVDWGCLNLVDNPLGC